MKIAKSSRKLYALAAALILSIAIIVSFAACSQNKRQKVDIGDISNIELTNKGKLTVAIAPGFIPLEFYDGPNLCGIDVDIAKMVADDLGLKINFVNVDFDKIIETVKNGDVDFGISGLTITPDIKNDALFSTPYYSDQKVIAVDKNSQINADNIDATLTDANTKISFIGGSTNQDYIFANFDKLQKFSKDKTSEIVASIKNNETDVCMVYKSYFDTHNDDLKIVKNIKDKDECVIAIPKEKENLYQALNKEIAIRLYDGSIGSIINDWANKE